MQSHHPDGKKWIENQNHQHVYNKLWLCKTQGVRSAPCPVKPKNYPVFYKPIINLYSLGAFAFKAEEAIPSRDEHPGLFWMEYLEGAHYTADGYWNGSSLENPITYRANKNHDVFESWIPDRNKPEMLEKWGREFLSGYQGPINFEWIGQTIIEVHLRKSLQVQLAIGDIENYKPSEADVIVPIFVDSKRYEINEWERLKLEYQFPGSRIKLTRSDRTQFSTNGKWRVGYILVSNLTTGREIRRKVHSAVINTNKQER